MTNITDIHRSDYGNMSWYNILIDLGLVKTKVDPKNLSFAEITGELTLDEMAMFRDEFYVTVRLVSAQAEVPGFKSEDLERAKKRFESRRSGEWKENKLKKDTDGPNYERDEA